MSRRRDKGDGGANALMFVVLIIVMYSCSQATKRQRAAEAQLREAPCEQPMAP